MRALAVAFSSLLVICGEVLAQSVVVPNANASVRGNGGVNLLYVVRTYMIGLPPSQLAGIPLGSFINGVSFRGYGTSAVTWPPTDTTYSNCVVTLGYALPIATWTGSFMSNFVNTPLPPVTVRTGPMVIETGTYVTQSGPGTNPWGDFFWEFQKPFFYIGGDLGILVTHQVTPPASPPLVEMVTMNPTAGVFAYSTTYQAVSGTTTNWLPITRVHYGYGTGCPGTGGMVPNLVQTNNVAGGGSMSFAVGNSPPGGIAIYAVGARLANVALPNGCTLITTPTLVFPALLNANGRNAFTASFPPGVSLTAYAQVFVIDAGAPGGFSATNGVTLTVSP